MTRTVWLPVLIVLAGCGARTDLDEGAPPPFDAGFDTFPCRWMFGEPTSVLVGVTGASLSAAVHGSVDEALALTETMSGPTAAIVSLAYPPPIVEIREAGGADAVFSAPDGYVAFDCDLTVRDRSFGAVRELMLGGGSLCSAGQQSPAGLTVLFGGESRSQIAEVDLTTLARRDIGFPLRFPRPPVRTASGGYLMAYFDSGAAGAGLAFVSADGGVSRRDDVFPTGVPILLPDRIRGAAVALWEDGSGWRIDRVAEDLTMTLLFRLGRVELKGQPVTNETELLMLMSDGSLTAAPLSGTALRPIPPPDAGIGPAQIVLRPGTSAGGVFYQRGTELIFRPLVCNR